MTGEVLRKKLSSFQSAGAEGGPGAERAWRLAFARAARDMMQLPVDFVSLSMARVSLSELLDLPPQRALILMLEGPEDGLGLLILSPDLLSTLIEMLTMGKCGSQVPEPRKPTRTDAAMLSPLADLALSNLEDALAEEGDLVWTSGFRFASFIEEARPLGLLLEDVSYRVMSARLSLAQGLRSGDMLLILPAEGRGRKPRRNPRSVPDSVARPAFAAGLAARVDAAPCQLEAVLTRLSMSVSDVMRLSVDQVVPLPRAGLEAIQIEGLDGRRIAEGKLGQHRGMRAVRLAIDDAGTAVPVTDGPVPALSPPAFTGDSWGTAGLDGAGQADFGYDGFAATGTD